MSRPNNLLRASDFSRPRQPGDSPEPLVRGPMTPGAPHTYRGPYADLETARIVAAQIFDDRRDLRLEDARIETLDGQRVEWAGPAR